MVSSSSTLSDFSQVRNVKLSCNEWVTLNKWGILPTRVQAALFVNVGYAVVYIWGTDTDCSSNIHHKQYYSFKCLQNLGACEGVCVYHCRDHQGLGMLYYVITVYYTQLSKHFHTFFCIYCFMLFQLHPKIWLPTPWVVRIEHCRCNLLVNITCMQADLSCQDGENVPLGA